MIKAASYFNIDENNEYFQYVVNTAQQYFRISDKELADDLKVSVPTIKRWKLGKNIPRKYVKKSIFKYFTNKVLELM